MKSKSAIGSIPQRIAFWVRTMATSTVQERRKRLVNRVGRHLPCNTVVAVSEFGKISDKIVGNILTNPADVKFRELRMNNKTIQRAVLSCHGGREFLSLLGFEKIKKHGEFFYFMSEPELDHLTQARDWLKDRVKACEASAEASSGRVCADTVLTIHLTSGQTLDGGFYAHETVADVYGFLQSSVVSGAVEDLRLSIMAPARILGEEMLAVSLADAKLVPKASLTVIKSPAATTPILTPASSSQPSRKNDSEQDAKEQLRLLKEYSVRKSRDAAAEKEKEDAMAKFRADRVARASKAQEDSGVEGKENSGHRRRAIGGETTMDGQHVVISILAKEC